MATGDESFTALLEDLQQLSVYLHGRGDKTLQLSRQFEENARRNPANKEYDLRQATMLDYQHSTWHEIGNLVDKLLKKYAHES